MLLRLCPFFSSSYSYGEINSAGCPFPGSSGKTEFGGQTVPAAFAWDGSDVGFELSDINRTVDGQVSFPFYGGWYGFVFGMEDGMERKF